MSITNQQFPLKKRHDTTFHRAWEYTPEITIMIQKSPIKLEWYHLFGPYLPGDDRRDVIKGNPV